MVEIIFNAGDYATLLAEAETLGFTTTDDNDNTHIVTNGTFASGGGWFLNVVGVVYEPIVGEIDPDNPPMPSQREGFWGRLRLNGEPEAMPSFSSAITQYVFDPGDIETETPGQWINFADGLPAPDWVGDIGVIA